MLGVLHHQELEMIARQTIVTVYIGLAFFGAWAGIVACGEDATEITPKPSTTDAAATSEASVEAGPSDAGPSDAAPDADAAVVDAGSGDSVCAAEAKRPACVKCCESNHTTGAQVQESATKTCGCQADVCATACADTACAATPKKPDVACAACIESALTKRIDGGADDDAGAERGACVKAVKDACTGSADCVAMDSCESACPKN